MKLDPDCVRDVLLQLQEILDYDDDLNLIQNVDMDLLEMTPLVEKYPVAQIQYTISRLCDAGFINPLVSHSNGFSFVFQGDQGITYTGNEFLKNIRDKKIWANTKKMIFEKTSSVSLDIISKFAAEMLSKHLGL